jgi:hypothetical protein
VSREDEKIYSPLRSRFAATSTRVGVKGATWSGGARGPRSGRVDRGGAWSARRRLWRRPVCPEAASVSPFGGRPSTEAGRVVRAEPTATRPRDRWSGGVTAVGGSGPRCRYVGVGVAFTGESALIRSGDQRPAMEDRQVRPAGSGRGRGGCADPGAGGRDR